MKTFFSTGLMGLVLFMASSCSPKQDRLWSNSRAALLNQSIAEVLADRLRADLPNGGTLLVIKHPRSEIGDDEDSEARFQALSKALKGTGFVLKVGGMDVPNRKRVEKYPAFVDIGMSDFWATVARWATREDSPVGVVLLQNLSPAPTASEAGMIPPIYGVVPVADPIYNHLLANGRAKILLLQQRNAAGTSEDDERDFEKKTAGKRVALFYKMLE